MAQTLLTKGFLAQGRKGRFVPGPTLAKLAQWTDRNRIVGGLLRGYLERLAKHYSCLAHFGVYENEMVHYVVREGGETHQPFTAEGTQLEGYCSAIGKILLAALPDTERESYLAGGPFIRLTDQTIIDPNVLRQTLAEVARQGFALDNCEIHEDLFCLAVPVYNDQQQVIGAISLAMNGFIPDERQRAKRIESLRSVAKVATKHCKCHLDF